MKFILTSGAATFKALDLDLTTFKARAAPALLHIPVKVSHHSGQTEPPDKERIFKI